MATHHIATWATTLTPSALPRKVLNAATASFHNWVGCAVGGSHHPTTLKALSALSPFFGAQKHSSLLGHHGDANRWADAQHAALINGIASHVHDYDDTHLETIIHPTGPVASALLAAAEWRGDVSGADFLCALVAGVEVECKLGRAVWPEHYDVGWHITSTVGSIGAAVAVGKVLGLDMGRMKHAVGIAATQVTGLREMFGSDTKAFHVGRAAQNGLLAAVLAEKGFTSSARALEARRGWAKVVSVREDLEKLVAELGEGVWEIEKNAFKPFPCGIVCHPGIDACISLKRELEKEGREAEEIEEVTLQVHPLVLELTGKRTPRDGLEAKFSIYHSCAVGLLYGRATPAEYTDAIAQDQRVISLRDKISATADENLAPDAAVVKVVLGGSAGDDGVFERRVEHAVGSLKRPMTDDELREKFLSQSKDVLGDGEMGAKRASEACLGIGQVEDVRDVTNVL